MKILHTSDWHVGRRWKGLTRLDEMERVLDHLAATVEAERVDLVLHTGDLFDARSPSPEAEALVHRFFVRLRRAGARTVVIAGNHDDPVRMEARGLLAEFVGVDLVGRLRRAVDGGVRALTTRAGELAMAAVLPFASPATFLAALELSGDEVKARARYATLFARAVAELSRVFRPDAVNLLLAHTHLEGAVFGESERRVHVGEDWAAPRDALPSSAAYVALGHIHKPQLIDGPVPALYAGSPLQMDFGESGEEKSFVLLDAAPGRPVELTRVPYRGGTPLRVVRAGLAELEQRAAALGADGWLKVLVPLAVADPDVARKVRALLPNALVVTPELPLPGPALDAPGTPLGSAAERYAAYHLREYGRAAGDQLLTAFSALYAGSGEDC